MPGRAAPPPGRPCTGLGGGATGVRREGAEGTDRWRRLPRDLSHWDALWAELASEAVVTAAGWRAAGP